MAFAVDDFVYITPADKGHPAISDGSSRYGRVLDTMVNGRSDLYRVAVAGLNGLFLMAENELSTVVGPAVHSSLVAKLPTPKTKGNR